LEAVPSGIPTAAEIRSDRGSVADLLEVALLIALAGAGLTASHLLDADSRAGTTAAFVAIMIQLAVVLVIHRRRGDPWSALGLGRPRSRWKTVGLALIAFPVVVTIAGSVQALVLLPLAGGQQADVGRFDALQGNLPLLLLTLVGVWISAAFAEEVIYRGFLMGRLARLFGGGRLAWWSALLASACIFGVLHLYQGFTGVAITGLMGFLLGALYLVVRRNLWVGILVHGLVDTMSLTMIYLGAAQ
jgi:membrane protease YdiL (CAAX protease family)